MEDPQQTTVRTRNKLGITIGAVSTVIFGGLTYVTKKFSLAENFFNKGTPSENFANPQMVTMRDQFREQYDTEKGFFKKLKIQNLAVKELAGKIEEQGISWKDQFKNQSNLYKAGTVIAVVGLIASATMLIKNLIGRKENITLQIERNSEQLARPQHQTITQEEARLLAERQANVKKEHGTSIEQKRKQAELTPAELGI